MKEFIKQVTAERAAGSRPSPVRAILAAGAVGVVAAGITYRLLRN
jgi:hypothetical protein